MEHPTGVERAPESGQRPVLDFGDPTFETTLGAAGRYLEVAGRIPRASAINVAFVEPADLVRRFQVIDALLAAGLRPRPIISTRRVESRDMLRELLHAVGAARNLEGVLVVGGDPAVAAGPYDTALDLLRSPEFSAAAPQLVGLPGFPDHHPALDGLGLLESLHEKVMAVQTTGRTAEITTQVCVDPHAVHRWITAVRARGITAAIRVGIPAPTSMRRLLRFCQLCRVPVTAGDTVRWGWADNPQGEAADPTRFIATLRGLLDPGLGPIRVHAYPMGELPAALDWLAGQQ